MAYKNKKPKINQYFHFYLRHISSNFRFITVAALVLLSKTFHLFSTKSKHLRKISESLRHRAEKIDIERAGNISRVDIVEIAIANLNSKKSRTYITIGGVVVGITTVVLLVSIGYGLQNLVVTRVARLEELRQIDVYSQTGSKLKVTDKTLSDIKSIEGVDKVLPLISVVGRVSYLKSVSDLAVFGVTTDFLKSSAVQPYKGKLFDSNDLILSSNQVSNKIQKIDTAPLIIPDIGVKIQDVSFVVNTGSYLKVRESADQKSKLLGYLSSSKDVQNAEEYYGASYLDDSGHGESATSPSGDRLGKWLKISAPLYQKTGVGYIPDTDENNSPIISTGYVAEINISLTPKSDSMAEIPSTVTPTSNSSPTSSIVAIKDGWVEIASESANKDTLQVDEVNLSDVALREAIVNKAMLNVLGLKDTEAVGKLMTVSFVVTGNLLDESQRRIESAPVQYKIVGVTPDTRTAQFFVPFVDVRSLGITNYSQAKVIVKNASDLVRVRRQIEGLGFKTRSVVDTVNQINQLFSTLRAFLAILGLVALFVAAVGMFNTLTVSLMERTREVGLMKAMGMRSSEIKELFLAESLIMSTAGGTIGIILGMFIGKTLEIIISIYSLARGAGYLNLTHTPPIFAFGIILLALFVGLVTGYYPSRRATKISALDALRYE